MINTANAFYQMNSILTNTILSSVFTIPIEMFCTRCHSPCSFHWYVTNIPLTYFAWRDSYKMSLAMFFSWLCDKYPSLT